MLISGLTALCSLPGCNSSDCEGNRNTLPLAGFMSSEAKPQAVAIDTLRIAGVGAPADSVLSVYNASQAYLPLDVESHTTTYVFRYNRVPEALYDTLRFDYDVKPWFESPDCGVVYIYNVREIGHTTHFVDSVTCPGAVIDNTPKQNIFIYFHQEEEAEPAERPLRSKR